MFNAKRMKIMKKLFYSVLAFAGILAVSCNKEVDKQAATILNTEPASTHTVTIRADFGADTRTAYANDKTFSWVEGDKIYVYTINEATSYARFAELTAESSGATADFTGEVEDGFELSSLAFYAHSEWVTWDEENFYIYLPGTTAIDDDKYSYHVESSNPMSNVPLSGFADSEGVFHFMTSTGVVKFNLTDLPSDAQYFELAAADGNMLSGLFAVDFENGQLNRDGAIINWSYTDDQGEEQTERVSYTNLFYKFTPDAQGKATIYVPVPVGTLGSGASIRIYNDKDEVIFTKKTTKDITVTRNKITELTALSCTTTWESIGTGQYNDAEYLYDLYLEDMDVSGDDIYVDVDILKSSSNANEYKIVKPYAAYNTLFGYTTTQTVNAPNDMTLTILRAGDALDGVKIKNDGLVYFEQTYLGFYSSSEAAEMFLYHPSVIMGLDTEDSWTHNYVMKFQSDGVTPANIQLAPMYFYDGLGCYPTDATADCIVQIVFPGAEPLDVWGSVGYDSILDEDVDQPIAAAYIEIGANIASADLVVATSAEAAAAALASGSNVTHVDASADDVEVLLPANAASGTYKVYARLNGEEGLSPLVTRIIESGEFKYYRSDENKDVQIEDVIGTYANKRAYIYLNSWKTGTISMTIEESDDPMQGDLMVTAFNNSVATYSNTNLNAPFVVYAWLDSRKGLIEIDPLQPISEIGSDGYYSFLGNYDDPVGSPVVFEVSDDKKTLTSQQFFGIFAYNPSTEQAGYYNIYFSPTDVPLVLTKQASGVAAAQAPAIGNVRGNAAVQPFKRGARQTSKAPMVSTK